MITVAEARARGIALPSDNAVAQDIVDEWEAWLARRIGPLDGSRTETFWVQRAYTGAKLALRRYTASVSIVDGTATLTTNDYRLTDNGSSLSRINSQGVVNLWAGPFVAVAYEPNDDDEVRRVLFALLALAVDEHADAPYVSEHLGDYSYSKGSSVAATDASRATLVASLLPKRDPLVSITATRRVDAYDPVINRAEPVT